MGWVWRNLDNFSSLCLRSNNCNHPFWSNEMSTFKTQPTHSTCRPSVQYRKYICCSKMLSLSGGVSPSPKLPAHRIMPSKLDTVQVLYIRCCHRPQRWSTIFRVVKVGRKCRGGYSALKLKIDLLLLGWFVAINCKPFDLGHFYAMGILIRFTPRSYHESLKCGKERFYN